MRNYLLAAAAVLTLASPVFAASAPPPLASLGAPALTPGDANGLIGFAGTLGGSERRDLNTACEVIIASPGSSDPAAVTYCHELQVAESLAPRVARDQDAAQN